MIKTIEELNNQYRDFSDVHGKIKREVQHNKFVQVVRGLYETDPYAPGHLLGSYIYGPSYLSSLYALYHYGMIPERVYAYTSATYNKRKTKQYDTPFGTYIYRDVPKTAYPFDILAIEENGYVYYIASKEKALCDKLYALKPLSGLSVLNMILFEDLRIDRESFDRLDRSVLKMLIPKYGSTNLELLGKMISRKRQQKIL